MDEIKENEISLYDLWMKIWNNIVLVVLITLALSLTIILSFYFYNKNNTLITKRFNYHFLNSEVNKYPNGENFNYRDINTVNFLKKIKESDEKFNDIKVAELVNDNHIIIDYINDNEGKFYEFSLPISKFNGDFRLANDFLNAINDQILNSSKEKLIPVLNDTLDQNFIDSLTYIELINEIKQYNNYIVSNLNKFITKYNNPVLKDGKTASDLLSNFERWFQTEVYIDLIEHEIISNGYIWNENKTESNLKNIELIEKKINDNNVLLDEYTNRLKDILENGSSITGTESILLEIQELIKTNHSLNLELDYYLIVKDNNKPKKDSNNEDFDLLIKSIITKLKEFTNEFNTDINEYHISNTYISILTNKVYNVEKPFNLTLIVVVALIISGFIAVSAGLIYEQNKKIKL